MFKSFTSALALAIGAEAAPRFLASCPKDYSPIPTLDLDRYLGQWYEIRRDKYTPFEIALGCDVATYTANEDGTVGVHNQGHRPI